MLVLGLSAATPILSVGLVDQDEVLAEYSSSGAKSRSEDLVIFIDSIIKKTGLSLKDVKAVAVTIGPGSYAGIRGGMTTAKTLAQVMDVPIVGVSTLEAIAYNLLGWGGVVAALTDARRDEYNLALFGAAPGRLNRLTEDLIVKENRIVDLLSKIRGLIYLAGNTSRIYNALLEKNPKTQIRIADTVHSFPRGAHVARLACLAARLGWERVKEGKAENYFALAPYYSAELRVKEFKP